MTEKEFGNILKSIDAALEVYRNHKGSLSAAEISVKSMLIVLRAQAVDLLSREPSSTSE